MKVSRRFFFDTWTWLVGKHTEFKPENRAFNSISVFTMVLLLILLPFNALIGLYEVCILILVVFILQAIFYYFARFRKQYTAGFIAYAIASYLMLVFNYFYNSGSLGPTLFLFFLSFQLLIAFTRPRQHIFWVVFHLAVPFCLLMVEYYRPGEVGNTYSSYRGRFLDLASSYLIIILCMYLVTIFLRNNYNREKRVAEDRAYFITAQNEQILSQNERLEELNREKNKLFSIISHDLRNPLNNLLNALQLLTDNDLDEEERKVFEKELVSMTQHTSDMVLNLLAWAATQMQGAHMNLRLVNVLQVVQKVLLVQQPLADKKHVHVSVAVLAEVWVMADGDMLELVIRNLFSNAIKFTHPGGFIRVLAVVEGRNCVVRIKDNGIGMTTEEQERLFMLRGEVTYGTNNEKGVGLGLHLCREFIELQQGQIWVESVKGVGSSFFISLPTPSL